MLKLFGFFRHLELLFEDGGPVGALGQALEGNGRGDAEDREREERRGEGREKRKTKE
jgi:hypothetical protein